MLKRSILLPMASSSPPRQRFLIRRPGQCQLFREPLGEDLELEMVWIPPGRFWMGSPPEEPERDESEGPQHLVQLQGFFLGRTPITQAQWRVVAGWRPAEGQPRWERELETEPASVFQGDDWPVVEMNWFDAMEFCRRLQQRTGRNYTLPSEARWEYACRAGTTTPFHFGATISPQLASYNASMAYAEGPTGAARSESSVVAKYPANAWGLHDMHGNVWEWCLDHWHPSYQGAPSDGSAWIDPAAEETAQRLLRGGSWCSFPRLCRSAGRSYFFPGNANFNVGFRVCCLPQGPVLDP
jgi:formylglycine-generating enzyme required for sulfatase activity